MTLESLREAAAALSQELDIQIVDAASGLAVIDTRHRYLGPELPEGLRRQALANPAALGAEGVLTLDGHRVAYKRLTPEGENANDWIVVARSRTEVAGWLGTVSVWQGALFLVIALFIPLAFFGWRRSQTDLNRAANTDSLTGLGNRRRLMLHLQAALLDATSARALLLAMYDLDGFKMYNDTYGHPAGMRCSCASRGSCVPASATTKLAPTGWAATSSVSSPACSASRIRSMSRPERPTRSASTAKASASAPRMAPCCCPTETGDPVDALRLADQRMYAHKSSSRLSASRQTTDVLMQMIAERDADLGEHVSRVVELATQSRRPWVSP